MRCPARFGTCSCPRWCDTPPAGLLRLGAIDTPASLRSVDLALSSPATTRGHRWAEEPAVDGVAAFRVLLDDRFDRVGGPRVVDGRTGGDVRRRAVVAAVAAGAGDDRDSVGDALAAQGRLQHRQPRPAAARGAGRPEAGMRRWVCSACRSGPSPSEARPSRLAHRPPRIGPRPVPATRSRPGSGGVRPRRSRAHSPGGPASGWRPATSRRRPAGGPPLRPPPPRSPPTTVRALVPDRRFRPPPRARPPSSVLTSQPIVRPTNAHRRARRRSRPWPG